jgi:hypothetical protein
MQTFSNELTMTFVLNPNSKLIPFFKVESIKFKFNYFMIIPQRK